MQLRVYLAGPITGQPNYNEEAFTHAAEIWRTKGWEVINPLELDGDDRNNTWRNYMKRDIPILITCDAIAMLPNWQTSEGATLEQHIASKLGIRQFDAFHPAAHPITDHDYIEGTNVCCFAPDYMHLRGWRGY